MCYERNEHLLKGSCNAFSTDKNTYATLFPSANFQVTFPLRISTVTTLTRLRRIRNCFVLKFSITDSHDGAS